MSDPVTNVEIEDVLASIKKLISRADGLPPETRDRSSATPASAALVLTPAQRIPGRDGAESEPEVAVDSMTPEEAPWTEEAGHSEERADNASEPLWLPARGSAARDSLLATIAELEAAVGRTPQDFEPDGSETEPQVDWDAIDAPPRSARAALDAPLQTPSVRPEPDSPPDRTGSPNPAPEPLRLDAAARTGRPAVEPVATDEGSDRRPSPLADEDPVIDEDALRDLVAEIVREELQGALGERITRNVRKLVRREIYRILSAQDVG